MTITTNSVVSRTAVWALAARAIGSKELDAGVRNTDWVAERFLGDVERSLLGGSPLLPALDAPYDEALRDPETSAAVRYLMQRTRFIDDNIECAVADGARQVVVLGAGFDSRAVRLRRALDSGIGIFEVDRASTQQYKRRRLVEILGRLGPQAVYVAANLRHVDLVNRLQREGYDPRLKTVFVWEGVTMYLPERFVRHTLEAIASRSAAGSCVLFDYWTRRHVEELPKIDERTRQRRALVAQWGEPVIFGIPDETQDEFVASCGLDLVERIPAFSEQAVARFLTRADGTRVGLTPWPPPAPPLGSHGVWLGRAVVPDRALARPHVSRE
jgi:methyltransferase (TIGR00027 family)